MCPRALTNTEATTSSVTRRRSLRGAACGVACVVAAVAVTYPRLTYAQSAVPKWSVFEISLTANGTYANPYTETTISAVFQGPNGLEKTVCGFWDGGTTFRLRFTPTAEGTWSYKTSSSDAGLGGKTGSLHCVAPVAGRHGFLRIDPKYRASFVWDDGTRCFLWGQTYYNMIRTALVNDNWKAGVDQSMACGLNKVRMNVYAFGSITEDKHDHGYPDAQPYLGDSDHPDRDRLNLPYWRKLDEIVAYLDSKPMMADLILVTPYNKNRAFGDAAQNDRYVRYVASRYAVYPNVMWCLANEWNYSATYGGAHPQSQADFNRMGGVLRSADPWLAEGAFLRPLSTHQQTRIDYNFAAATWPTHVIVQYGVRNRVTRASDEFKPTSQTKYHHGDQWGNASIVYNLGHRMPVVNDECGYIGEVKPIEMTPAQSRRVMWGIATAGGYGSSGDWRLLTDWRPSVTGEWADAEQYGDLKRMIDFFTTKNIEYWRMSSHNSLATQGTRIYVLAEPRRQYVIYAAIGGICTVDLAPGTYAARRYNPRTGDDEAIGEVSGGVPRTFTLPDTNDWVIYLKAASGLDGTGRPRQ